MCTYIAVFLCGLRWRRSTELQLRCIAFCITSCWYCNCIAFGMMLLVSSYYYYYYYESITVTHHRKVTGHFTYLSNNIENVLRGSH